MPLPKLPCGKNLKAEVLELSEPWLFAPTEDALEIMRDKKQRRIEIEDPETDWNVYSGFAGVTVTLRVSKTNPGQWMFALVVDYDKPYTIAEALEKIEEHYQSNTQAGKTRPIPKPNLVERTLSGNIRLLWLFERPVSVPTPGFAEDFFGLLRDRLQFDMIMRGYDAASSKPSQMWTNSGEWHVIHETPVKWEWLLGLAMEVSKKQAHEGIQGIPLPLIKEEFEKRWPGKWRGEFVLDETGVRIWDEKADNPAGCQIKYDGMLCFTGPFPFRSWSDILGAEWVKHNTALNTGKLIEAFRFDVNSSDYYHLDNNIWTRVTKDAAMTRLRNRGVSGRIGKGVTNSQMDEIIEAIETTNKISGVGPIISKPPGIIEYNGEPFLNTYRGQVVPSVRGKTGTEADFPLIWRILQGFQTTPKSLALSHFLYWLRRRYISQRDYLGVSSQAVFICGPPNTGKTLVAVWIVAYAIGGHPANYANPFKFFTGQTDFNVQLFSTPMLMVNDEESPSHDSEKKQMHTKIKGAVVNPQQTVHAKFKTPVVVDWKGGIIWTLNEDAGDVYQIPEITPSTDDKLSFFRMIDTGIEWNLNHRETEAQIKAELPFFLWWLEHVWSAPKEILATGRSKYQRVGMISYFDPTMRRYALQNTDAYSVLELLEEWMKYDDHWRDNNGNATENETWLGTSAELLTKLSSHDSLKPLLHGVTAKNLPKSLVSLSKISFSGVSVDPDARRHFVIHRERQ